MNVFQDITNVASNVIKSHGNISDFGKSVTPRARIRSLSSFAGNAIYYFPVLLSSTVTADTAGMMAVAYERVYCSFMRAAFSLMPAEVVNGNQVNVEEYLKQFHQNIGIDSSYYSIRLESASQLPWTTLKNPILNEATQDIRDNTRRILRQADLIVRDRIDTGANDASRGYERVDQHGRVVTPLIDKGNRGKADVESQNAMQPSIVTVNVKFLVGQQSRVVDVSMPIGVKTQLHVLDAVKICDRVTDSIVGRGVVHDLIRWSTGEMLSLKDILFGVSKIKRNVSSENKDEVDEWFNTLESRKRLSEMSLPVLNKQAFLPNTSVVLTMSDVKMIQNQYGIDLMDIQYARKLIKNNFLLSLSIVDDMTDTLHVLYDGHAKFEYYPYSTISRENASHNREMQTLIRAIGKMK